MDKARGNNIFREGLRILRKTGVVFLSGIFLMTTSASFVSGSVDIEGSSSVMPDLLRPESQYSLLDVDTFTIPPHLGEVRFSHKGDSARIVVHVQDAHCNYFAQTKIADIIDYLNKEYGICMLNVEGGAGDYDLSAFTSISGSEIRREVAEYFVKRGEVNGAELYAINNPDDVLLWGIEDKDLYLKNLKVYRDSLAYKSEVDEYLKSLRHIFNNLKRHIFPDELLKIDMAYNSYKAGKMDFKKYLDFIISTARGRGLSVKKYPNVYLISQAIEQESGVDFKRANAERSVLVDKIKGILSRNEMEELISKTVEFRTKRMSVKDFYNYLLRKARECGFDTSDYPALSSYIVYVSLFEAVDSFYVMEELDMMEAEIKEPLYRKESERALDRLSRNLALMSNIFELLLTKNDFAYYRDNRELFRIRNFLGFIEREAPAFGITARPPREVWALDKYIDDIIEFYKISFERDEAFIRNMRFAAAPEGREAALIMTGGFHSENLSELFRREGYSYVSIMPKFTSEEDYDNPYFAILAGQTADIQQMLRSALAESAMLQVVSLLNTDPDMAKKFYGASDAVDNFKLAVDVVTYLRVSSGTLAGVDILGIKSVTDEGIIKLEITTTSREKPKILVSPEDMFKAKRSTVESDEPSEKVLSLSDVGVTDGIVSAISGLMRNFQSHDHPNVNVIGLSNEEYEIEASYTQNMRNEIGRSVRSDTGNPNYHEIFYNRDADQDEISKQITGGMNSFTENLSKDQKQQLRVVIFSDGEDLGDKSEKIKNDIVSLVGEKAIVGVVGAEFRGKYGERFSRVALAYLGMGFMERNRAPEGSELEKAITESLRSVLLQMTGKNSNIVQAKINEMGIESFMREVLLGKFIIPIKKINYENIRAFIAAEKEILRSL
ncbi:MAG: hypothetical protein WCV56_00840 [Candidatus Omnitrophota bacterium]